jgi:imidazolonepropionase-like amidohydrolase
MSRLVLVAALSCPALHGQSQLALTGATIYPSPEEAPIANGLILIEGSRITAVGDAASLEVPPAARSIDCSGLTITAGFWNSHVHLFERKWENAAAIPRSALARQVEEMFTQFGFTNVFDLGSPGENTRRIRDRINSGEAPGPNIRSTGEILIAPGAMPSPKALKSMGFISFLTPEIRNARGAAAAADDLLDAGADGVKLHLKPPPAPGPGFPRRAIRAAVEKAHARNKPVFVHPHNGDDVAAALKVGVEVIAHTTPHNKGWERSVLPSVSGSGTVLIPTLALWKYSVRRESLSIQERVVGAAVGQLRSWLASGGAALFGTDAGAIGYDPSDEYTLMADAGMTFSQILASLTTTPAELFGESQNLGRVAPGFQADLVVLEGDPAEDIAALTDVKHTVRRGEFIYSADD